MSTKAAVYARLSKNRDGEKDATLDFQIVRGKEIASVDDWAVVDILSDSDLSGGKADRPAYLNLKGLVETGRIDVVIVQDTDRLNRNQVEASSFRDLCAQNDVAIRTWQGFEMSTETSMGKLTTTMSDAVAEYYKNNIGDKVKSGHQRRLTEGRLNGMGRMFGEQSPEQADIVRDLAARTLKGESLNSMARWLNAKGHKATRGNPWQATTLKGLLTNPRLAGDLYYKGQPIGKIADYDPILTDETFMKVKGVLTSPKLKVNRGRPSRLLTPFLRCGTCGGPMKGSSNGERKMYTCRSDQPCERRMTVSADKADEVIVERLLARLEVIEGLAELVEAEEGAQMSGLRAELDGIEGQQVEAATSFAEGRINMAQLETITETLDKRASAVTAEIGPVALQPDFGNIRERWENGSYQWRKGLLAEYVDRITVVRPTISPRNGFDGNRLITGWKGLGEGTLAFDLEEVSEERAAQIAESVTKFLASQGFEATSRLAESLPVSDKVKQALARHIASEVAPG